MNTRRFIGDHLRLPTSDRSPVVTHDDTQGIQARNVSMY